MMKSWLWLVTSHWIPLNPMKNPMIFFIPLKNPIKHIPFSLTHSLKISLNFTIESHESSPNHGSKRPPISEAPHQRSPTAAWRQWGRCARAAPRRCRRPWPGRRNWGAWRDWGAEGLGIFTGALYLGNGRCWVVNLFSLLLKLHE